MAMSIALLLVLVIAPAAVYGAAHTVGGSSGWSSGVDYTAWASGETFTVGDTLVFTFGGNHAVDEVNAADYTACSSSNIIKNHGSSPTTITLTKAGTTYYICPTPGHCSNGMKLSVSAVAAGTPSPTPATPPSSNDSPPPPTSTTPSSNDSPPPPPPPPNIDSAASSSVHVSLAGVTFVLVTLVAFMG